MPVRIGRARRVAPRRARRHKAAAPALAPLFSPPPAGPLCKATAAMSAIIGKLTGGAK